VSPRSVTAVGCVLDVMSAPVSPRSVTAVGCVLDVMMFSSVKIFIVCAELAETVTMGSIDGT